MAMPEADGARPSRFPRRSGPPVVRTPLGPTRALLVDGGDDRIVLDPARGENRYGCAPAPDPGLVALGSSTASVISRPAYAVAELLRRRLSVLTTSEPAERVYAREVERVRAELRELCGLDGDDGTEVVLAASGTDLHLMAAELVGGAEGEARPLVVNVQASETGSAVPAALAGRHFSSRAALGRPVVEGAAIARGCGAELVAVPLRHSDGKPRPPAHVDADVAHLVERAANAGRRVLLVLVDSSKTGLVAPGLAGALALRSRFGDRVELLLDACQFRLSPTTLRAYLARDVMVAMTGSKFLAGPSFCGALLAPRAVSERLRSRPLRRGLWAYSARADWPETFVGAAQLDEAANFGLLLRWEAALSEWRTFAALPEAEVARFLSAFAAAVGERLASDPAFQPLAAPPIARSGLFEDGAAVDAGAWDRIQTNFPFVLRRPDGTALDGAATARVHRELREARRGDGPLRAQRFQLGQPVHCGSRDGVPVSALRLCASARLCTLALHRGGPGIDGVIDSARKALDKAALLAAL